MLSNLFIPNKSTTKQTQTYITAGWITFGLACWCFSGFVFLPKPTEVYNALLDLWTNSNLGLELFVSFKLNIEAILISTLLSLGLVYLSTISIFRPIISLFGKLRFLSLVGLSLIFVLMTNNGHQLKLSILVFSISVFFVTGMLDVIANIPKELFDLAKTLKMNAWQELYEVVILSQANEAFIVLRQNVAMGWLMLSTVEALDRSDGGIATLLLNQGKYFHLSAMFGIQVTILIIGLVQDQSIEYMRKFCCPWTEK